MKTHNFALTMIGFTIVAYFIGILIGVEIEQGKQKRVKTEFTQSTKEIQRYRILGKEVIKENKTNKLHYVIVVDIPQKLYETIKLGK